MQAITINYGSEIDRNTLKPLRIITLTVDLEGLQNVKVTQGAEYIEQEILDIQEQIKQIIIGE